MRTHSRKIWPLFLAFAVVSAVGLFVFDGVVSGVILFFALIGLLATCIYGLTGEDVNDGAGGIAGGTGW